MYICFIIDSFHSFFFDFRFRRGSSYPRFFYPKESRIAFSTSNSSSLNPYVLKPILPPSFVILVSAFRNRFASSLNSSTLRNPPASMFIYSPLRIASSSSNKEGICSLKYISFSAMKLPSIENPRTSLF